MIKTFLGSLLGMMLALPAVAQQIRIDSVFFDWNKATLTNEARQRIRQASIVARQSPQIIVNGYTDTSGLPGYNQTLSGLRARNVAAELARNGVPAAAIHVQEFGESRPLVPDPDEVRVAENRRVDINILQPPPIAAPRVAMAPYPFLYPYPVFPQVYWGGGFYGSGPWGWRGGWGGGWRGGWGGWHGGGFRGGWGGWHGGGFRGGWGGWHGGGFRH